MRTDRSLTLLAGLVCALPARPLMIARASTPFVSKLLVDLNGGPVNECELIAKLVDGGAASGYLYNGSSFDSDDAGPAILDTVLRAKAATLGQGITYTCVPPGSGQWLAIDRDGDSFNNGVAMGTGVFANASDTGSRPDRVDSDGDGVSDADEVANGTDPNVADPARSWAPVFQLEGRVLRARIRRRREPRPEIRCPAAVRAGPG